MNGRQSSVWDYRELEFEHAVRAIAREAGWVSGKLTGSNGKGIPDVMFLNNGRVIFVEFKTGSYEMTVEQRDIMRDLRNGGHVVLEVRPDNVHEFVAILLAETGDTNTELVLSMLRDVSDGISFAARERRLNSTTAGKPPFGYRVANKGSVTSRYVVVEAEALVVRECFRLAVAGYSQRAIAKILTESPVSYESTKQKGAVQTSFTASWVCKLLANEAYIGTKFLRWGGRYIVKTDVFPRLCTDEDWRIVRALTARNARGAYNAPKRLQIMATGAGSTSVLESM